MRIFVALTFISLVLLGCTGRILLPSSSVIDRRCENGVCMPYLNLNILITPISASHTYTLTLLNPHKQDDGECLTENTLYGVPVLNCSYRAARLAHPYYFVVTVFPARDATESTCLLNPEDVSVQRLDVSAHFLIQRIRTSGICFYEVRLRDPALPH